MPRTKKPKSVLRFKSALKLPDDCRLTPDGVVVLLTLPKGTEDDVLEIWEAFGEKGKEIDFYLDPYGLLAQAFSDGQTIPVVYQRRDKDELLGMIPRLDVPDAKIEEFSAEQLAVLLAFYERSDVHDPETAAKIAGVPAIEITRWMGKPAFSAYFSALQRYRGLRIGILIRNNFEIRLKAGERLSPQEIKLAAHLANLEEPQLPSSKDNDAGGNSEDAAGAAAVVSGMSEGDIEETMQAVRKLKGENNVPAV